jgi:hypothetical protein
MQHKRCELIRFTIPILKCSFLKRIFIFFSCKIKEHFTVDKKEKKKTTIGIVKLHKDKHIFDKLDKNQFF